MAILTERQKRQRQRLLGEGRRLGLRLRNFTAFARYARPLKEQGYTDDQIIAKARKDQAAGIDWNNVGDILERILELLAKWLPIILAIF
jgi:hypothetical protein